MFSRRLNITIQQSFIFSSTTLSYLFWNTTDIRDKTEKAKASLKNSELIQRFKEVDSLPEDEQGVLIKIISAYVRDYRAKQAYAS